MTTVLAIASQTIIRSGNLNLASQDYLPYVVLPKLVIYLSKSKNGNIGRVQAIYIKLGEFVLVWG